MIRGALDTLSQAGVPFATRGEQPIDDPPPGGDVDILVSSEHAAAADRALRAAGFHHLAATGHRGHRFYLAFDRGRGRWLKIDVSLVPRRLKWDLSARDEEHLRRFAGYRIGTKANPGLAERAWSAVARRRPLAARRRGPVVAVLGPDGAGKGSVIAALSREIPAHVKPVYLGHGELSRGEYRRRAPGPVGRLRRRWWRTLRSALRSAVRRLPPGAHDAQWRIRHLLLSSAHVFVAYLHAWQGDIVICDRHPLEDLAVGPPGDSPVGALQRRILRLVPWPDAAIVLDAPGEVLFQRKGDHSPAVLEQWRRAYREVFGARGAAIVSAVDPLEQVVAAASAVVWDALRVRRGW